MKAFNYDEDYEDEIPNETTLRAMEEAKQIAAAWRKLNEYYTFTNEDNDRPLSPETLIAIEETKKIAAIWEKLTEDEIPGVKI